MASYGNKFQNSRSLEKRFENTLFQFQSGVSTSNGGYRREEKSRKHWSLFTKLLSSVTAIFFIF